MTAHAHSGVGSGVAQITRVFGRIDGLGDAVARQFFCTAVGSGAKDQDVSGDAFAAQGERFLKVGDGEKADAHAFQFRGDIAVSVAVSVGFDDGDDAGILGDRRADRLDIAFQSVEIDLRPCSFQKFHCHQNLS